MTNTFKPKQKRTLEEMMRDQENKHMILELRAAISSLQREDRAGAKFWIAQVLKKIDGIEE